MGSLLLGKASHEERYLTRVGYFIRWSFMKYSFISGGLLSGWLCAFFTRGGLLSGTASYLGWSLIRSALPSGGLLLGVVSH